VGSTGQTRTFTYTTLSRLQTASNPESGTASYTYYNNGNLNTRTDGNGTAATFTYDGINRPTGITYTPASPALATPSVQYSYDNNSLGAGFTGFVGALSSVSSSASKMEYSYDGLGRIVASRQTTPNNGSGTPYTFNNYTYSLTDQLTGITYPSGRAMSYTLDLADQITGVKGTPAVGSATTYATGVTYTAAGSLSSLPFNNGITETHTWNSMWEHTGVSAGTLLSLNFNYCNNGQALCTRGNTCSPWQQTIAVGGQTLAVQEYVHDPINRLTTASERCVNATGSGGCMASSSPTFSPTCPDSSSVWCRQFSYDNSGNVTVPNQNPGSNGWDVASFNTKNQAVGSSWGYDNAGNMTKGPGATIAYDAENRQVAYCTNMTKDPVTCPDQYGDGRTLYVYDGLGNRVQKIDSNNNATTYVYDAFGNLAAEYGGSTSITPGTQYLTMDGLGSTRLVMSGAQASERHDFQPFGSETIEGTWRVGVAGVGGVPGYGVDTVRQKFTGQERDNESYLDFFQARYFSGIQGRFLSPDPGNAGADPADPQSWNGYAYVSGNPLTFTDPGGLLAQANGGGGGSGLGGIIVAGLEVFGDWVANLFDGGGPDPNRPGGRLSDVGWTPMPTWSVTGWGMADTANSPGLGADGGVYTIPGLLFLAQATGAMPKTGARKTGSCLATVGTFVNLHLGDAGTLAKSLGNGVTPAEVLATAGNESAYGNINPTKGFAYVGNYFGLHGSGPAGSVNAKLDGPMQKFPLSSGFSLSGQEFVKNVGPYMQPGMGQTPLKFFQILNQHGYATGNPGYPAFMVRNDKVRGPYTLVNDCMGGR
jgi:RHS repeat-associated protein